MKRSNVEHFDNADDNDTDKPNVLVIMGDDIGISNLSTYSDGLLGYRTPNIDSIAKDGVKFLDAYAEQSCTAGRSAFITGQIPFRTGMMKVGLPGSGNGLAKEDPTLARLLKANGYNTGQFGKNHFGDRDEDLPTNHGFDEFFGNLYHLNAEEEPEHPDWPDEKKYPKMKKFRPRGVIKSKLVDGEQQIEDTGPLTKDRMRNVDREFLDAAKDYVKRNKKEKKPFFLWFNPTAMHFRTHPNKDIVGQSGKWRSIYHDVMIEHDKIVGELLDIIPDNTIVIYTTDNGPHLNTWPDAGTTPFRSEKNTCWEGAFRVPFLMKYKKMIKPGQIKDGMISHLDVVPTIMNMVGVPNIKDKLLDGLTMNYDRVRKYNVHLDGYDMTDYITGTYDESPRNEFFYFSDTGDLLAMRFDVWKLVFAEQEAEGTMDVWSKPFTYLRLPKIYNLKLDPYEMADRTSNTYWDWVIDHAFLIAPAQTIVKKFLDTFNDYPRRQEGTTFTVDKLLKTMKDYNFSK